MSRRRVWVTVEEPAGAGLDLALVRGRPGPVVTAARTGGTFLGLDRGAVFETDTGKGSPLPAVVALPTSAAAGCWIEAEICDLLTDEAGRAVLVTSLPGHPLPVAPLVRVAARMPDGRFAGAELAAATVRRANEQFRRNRAAGRHPKQPAWLPLDPGTRQMVGASIASSAERGLSRLPPRFLRGLRGLLDDDERILASIERPPVTNGGLFGWRHARDRRAALLILTDRQVLWLVDHVPPSRYLLDWGVDAELVPVERLRDLRMRFGADVPRTGLDLATDAGEVHLALPADLEPQATDFATLLARFIPSDSDGTVLRRYPVRETAFDLEAVQRFGQADEAMLRVAALAQLAGADALATFYSPRRERVRRSVAVIVTVSEILVDTSGAPTVRIPLHSLRLMALAMSPLVGRLELLFARGREAFTYPAPMATSTTAFVRTLRRAWANAA